MIESGPDGARARLSILGTDQAARPHFCRRRRYWGPGSSSSCAPCRPISSTRSTSIRCATRWRRRSISRAARTVADQAADRRDARARRQVADSDQCGADGRSGARVRLPAADLTIRSKSRASPIGTAATPPIRRCSAGPASEAAHILIVQVTPTTSERLPKTPREIARRIEQIQFNATLNAELEALKAGKMVGVTAKLRSPRIFWRPRSLRVSQRKAREMSAGSFSSASARADAPQPISGSSAVFRRRPGLATSRFWRHPSLVGVARTGLIGFAGRKAAPSL